MTSWPSKIKLLILLMGVDALLLGVDIKAHQCTGGYRCHCENGYFIDQHGRYKCIKDDIHVYDACSSDVECRPINASCSKRSDNVCDGRACMCNVGYTASADNSTCVKRKLIGERCFHNSECLSNQSYCAEQCKCLPTTRKTSGLRPDCTSSSRFFVGETQPFIHVFGCQDPNAEAVQDTCLCKDGYRPKTDEEYWRDPFNPVECVLNVTEAESRVFDGCWSDGDCPDNTYCKIQGDGACGVCLCNVGHVASADNTTCLRKYLIGERCYKHSDCLARLSYCDSQDKKCRCRPYTTQTSGLRPSCTFSSRYFLGEVPRPSSRCQDPNAGPGRDGRCECNIGYRAKTDREFWEDPNDSVECVLDDRVSSSSDTEIKILDVCGGGAICPRNAECTARTCGPSICVCSVGFVPESDRLSCVPGKLIGEACSKRSDCVSQAAYCDGTCKCHAFSQPTSRGTCVRRFFNRKPLRESCRSDRDCLDRGSACLQGVCVCRSGLREKSKLEFWNDVKDSRECVPRDFELGCPEQ